MGTEHLGRLPGIHQELDGGSSCRLTWRTVYSSETRMLDLAINVGTIYGNRQRRLGGDKADHVQYR
jgi:hypothetical protein